MRAYLGFVLRNRLKHLGNTVADIVLDNEPDKEHRDQHTYTRIDEVQEVICLTVKPGCQRMVYEFDGRFQEHCSQTAAYTHEKGKNDHNIPFRQLLQQVTKRRKQFSSYISGFHRSNVKTYKDNKFIDTSTKQE